VFHLRQRLNRCITPPMEAMAAQLAHVCAQKGIQRRISQQPMHVQETAAMAMQDSRVPLHAAEEKRMMLKQDLDARPVVQQWDLYPTGSADSGILVVTCLCYQRTRLQRLLQERGHLVRCPVRNAIFPAHIHRWAAANACEVQDKEVTTKRVQRTIVKRSRSAPWRG
jgi:hypothetical protein